LGKEYKFGKRGAGEGKKGKKGGQSVYSKKDLVQRGVGSETKIQRNKGGMRGGRKKGRGGGEGGSWPSYTGRGKCSNLGKEVRDLKGGN